LSELFAIAYACVMSAVAVFSVFDIFLDILWVERRMINYV
jgi:hypothetical protein